MEHNAQEQTWIPCSAAKRPLQPYVEDVTDEDLSIFSSYNPAYSNDFAFEGEDPCSYDFSPRPTTREGNALTHWQKEKSVCQKRPSEEGLPERRVRLRMGTEMPTDGKFHIDFKSC